MDKELDIFEKSLLAFEKWLKDTPKAEKEALVAPYRRNNRNLEDLTLSDYIQIFDNVENPEGITKPRNFNRMERFVKRRKCINDEIKHLKEEIKQLQSIIHKQLPDLSKPVRATQIVNLVDLQVLLGDNNWYDCIVEIKEQTNGYPTAYGWIYLPKEQEQLWLKDNDYSDWNGQSIDADMIDCPFTDKLIYLQVRFKNNSDNVKELVDKSFDKYKDVYTSLAKED